jgi:hypothetical protein
MKKRPLSCNILSTAIEILIESNYMMNRGNPVGTTAGCELDDRLSIPVWVRYSSFHCTQGTQTACQDYQVSYKVDNGWGTLSPEVNRASSVNLELRSIQYRD